MLPPEPLPDPEDAEAAALARCYARARWRAAQIRQERANKNPVADTFAGQAATGLEQDDLERPTHDKSYIVTRP